MNSETFISTLAPYRELYAKDADAALLTLRASGTPDSTSVTCKVETGRGLAVAGLHQRVGGSGRELCAGDMLLEALVACAGVSLQAAATALDIPLKSAIVTAEGDVDLRGTLGVSAEVAVGFREIRLRFDVQTDASPEQLEALLVATERYCVIYDTLRGSPRVQTSLQVI
jgi:uncharacterized OsmC-like protein